MGKDSSPPSQRVISNKLLKRRRGLQIPMTDDEKMEIIIRTFNELYDKNHPVRQNLYYMDTIEEVRIINGLDESVK